MSLDAWYESVWDALVNTVAGLTEFTTETVFYGEKQDVTTFPSAYVCPAPSENIPATFSETHWHPAFEILVVTENTDAKAGMLGAWKLCWKIAAALIADRTLGNVVQNLETPRFIPYPRGLGRGMEQHWVALIVICHRKY